MSRLKKEYELMGDSAMQYDKIIEYGICNKEE